MKKIFLALMAVAAIAFTSCENNDPKGPNEGNNNSQNDSIPQAKAADLTIAIGIDPDWLKIADFCIFDSTGTAAAKSEELVDLYTNWEPGKTFAELHTQNFAACTWTFKGYTVTQKFEPNDSICFRCELKLKENYKDILQAMEPSSKIKFTFIRVFATQVNAPEYMCHSNSTDVEWAIDALLQLMANGNPNFLEDMVKQYSTFLSGVYLYNGFNAGIY